MKKSTWGSSAWEAAAEAFRDHWGSTQVDEEDYRRWLEHPNVQPHLWQVAWAVGDAEGFVKLIIGEPHGEILGAHIIGAEATELIAELGLAITLEATHEEIEATIHAHPTLSEAVKEATEQAFGQAIHI